MEAEGHPEYTQEEHDAVAMAAAHAGASQCPVPHAASQPLPPGHPPTPFASASSLKPPSDPRCIFFRTKEDLVQTPPLSRAASVQADDIKKLIDSHRLHPDSASSLNPDTSMVLASRNSQLALVQTTHVSALLSAHFGAQSPAFLDRASTQTPPPSPPPPYSDTLISEYRQKAEKLSITSPLTFPITSMSTAGDNNAISPLYVIGGEGRAIWTKELEVALAAGAVDVIVHSLKDVPTLLPEGLMLGAILEREDPRDALVVKQGLPYKTLDELPSGSVIGTSSVRRVAQLRRRYPDLVFSDVRGNLNTRLAKLDSPTGPYTALVLAAAGLVRLNMSNRITAFLSAPVLMHAVGQGSLGIEVRKPREGATPATDRDAKILAMVHAISDWRATWRAEAERSLLRELEGGCSIPVGVETRFDDHEEIEGQRNEKVFASKTLEGHSIPLAAGDEADKLEKEDDGPPPLKRLATGNSDSDHTSSTGRSTTTSKNGVAVPKGPLNKSAVLPEDRATEPASAVYLSLTASVVSLDGSRQCEFSLRRPVATIDEARLLGIDVAKELAQKRGARAILDEVERHRRLAEEADNLRRRAEKEKRVRAAQESEKDATQQSNVWDDDKESRRKLEELLRTGRKGSVSQDAPPAFIGEIDRRGVARDDGQLKAWEV